MMRINILDNSNEFVQVNKILSESIFDLGAGSGTRNHTV
jgi:hypothetical protein